MTEGGTQASGDQRELEACLGNLTDVRHQLDRLKEDRQASETQLPTIQQDQRRQQERQHQVSQQLAQLEQRRGGLEEQVYTQQKQLLLTQLEEARNQEEVANTRHTSVQAHIDVLLQQEAEAGRSRQRSLKSTFFALKTSLDNLTGSTEKLIRLLRLEELQAVVNRYELVPQALEELDDKQYAGDVTAQLRQELDTAKSGLSPDEQKDLGDWKELPSQIDALGKHVRGAKDRLGSLPTRLIEARERMAELQRQHEAHSVERQRLGIWARWSLGGLSESEVESLHSQPEVRREQSSLP